MGAVEGCWVTWCYRGRVWAQHLLSFSKLSNTCNKELSVGGVHGHCHKLVGAQRPLTVVQIHPRRSVAPWRGAGDIGPNAPSAILARGVMDLTLIHKFFAEQARQRCCGNTLSLCLTHCSERIGLSKMLVPAHFSLIGKLPNLCKKRDCSNVLLRRVGVGPYAGSGAGIGPAPPLSIVLLSSSLFAGEYSDLFPTRPPSPVPATYWIHLSNPRPWPRLLLAPALPQGFQTPQA